MTRGIPRSKVEIRGAQYAVEKVFSDDFAFTVPSYQRPYAWTEEHAGDLLEDVLRALTEANGTIEDTNPYFLGSIVLIKGDRPDAEIVDGQQRLTTLTILLAALRAHLPHDEASDLTRYLYEKGSRVTQVPDRFRLQLRSRDVAFMQEYIQREGGVQRLRELNEADLSDSQQRILANARLFMEKIARLSPMDRLRLAQFLLTRCLLIVISTPDLYSAFRIFSVLNSRGLNLTAADVLKADILGEIPEHEREDYATKWEDLEESLGRRGFESLMSYTRAIYAQGKAQESILKDFREYILPKTTTSQTLIDQILVPLGSALYTVRQADYRSVDMELAAAVNGYLGWLNRIGNADWVPLAIMYLARNQNRPELLCQFFGDLERLAAYHLIKGADGHARAKRYGLAITALHAGGDPLASNSPLQLDGGERAEILKRLGGDLYGWNPHALQYILQRLDSDISGQRAPYLRSRMTIEHVLPQNPANQWLQWWPNKKERDQWKHRLGNLVLLDRDRNTKAGNADFDKKKRTYFTGPDGASPCALTSQVLAESIWTPAILEQRQNDLLNRVKQMWRL